MLNENLKTARLNLGISQEELAGRLHVVRQTVSKWEKGLSVPDAEMLVRVAEELEVSVSALLGEEILPAAEVDSVKEIAARLEEINTRMAAWQERRRKGLRLVSAAALVLSGLYLLWNALAAGYVKFAASFPAHEEVSVIGGADGPTAIMVVSGVDTGGIVVAAIVAAAAVVGLVWSRRR